MAEEPNLPPLSLFAPVAAMLAIHAAALVASTHLSGGGWPQRAWGPYHITAALLVAGLLGWGMRRLRGGADAAAIGRWLWVAAVVDLAASLVLAGVAFGVL